MKSVNVTLEEEKNSLKAAYKEAENDLDIQEAITDWAVLDGENWNA